MSSTSSHRHNLPAQVSSFIGRSRELEEVARVLRDHRLVTLTGSGGTGKTRLALHAAAGEVNHFGDGVWLVELAPLSSPELVVSTITKVVGAPEAADEPPLDALGVFLRKKRLLLVLDNCEHLLTECARITSYLLTLCPSLVVLATSREPLAIQGEAVLRVPPLRLPDAMPPDDPEQLLDYDAVRLFIERARAAEPSFRLSTVTAPSVVEICHRLDGIPLAIELAAVRVRGMGVAYMGARLDDRFRLLKSADLTGEPRQRTLLALVEWSYDLLSAHQRVLLRRLSVFVGAFPIEAAEAICAGAYSDENSPDAIDSDAVLDEVSRLVDKSLVQFDQESSRYRLLETIRLFSLEQLQSAGEMDDVRQRHFAYYLRLAEDGVSLIGGPSQGEWFARLEHEHDNLRAALDWVVGARRLDEAARMALGLWKFWHVRTYQSEGLHWLEQLLALDAAFPLAPELRPQLFNAYGVLAHKTHRFDRARAHHADALRLWTELGDRAGMSQALLDIGWLHFDETELEEAQQRARDALDIAVEIGQQQVIAGALQLGAIATLNDGRLDGVVPALERSLAIWRELGDIDSEAAASGLLAHAYQQAGDYERAKPLLAEAMRLQVRAGNYGDLIGTLVSLLFLAANAAKQREQARDAARVVGVMRAWEEATTARPSPWWESEMSRVMLARITRQLEPEAYEQAIAEGKLLSMAGLLALIDRITAPDSPGGRVLVAEGDAPPAPHAVLTPREVEVLRLVAQGLTNAEIARELVVTPRTVNAHLTSIYAKIGVPGRSAAIRYALDHHIG